MSISDENFISCSWSKALSHGVPRTENSMQAFVDSVSACKGGRPVRRRMESMFSPWSAMTFVTA